MLLLDASGYHPTLTPEEEELHIQHVAPLVVLQTIQSINGDFPNSHVSTWNSLDLIEVMFFIMFLNYISFPMIGIGCHCKKDQTTLRHLPPIPQPLY